MDRAVMAAALLIVAVPIVFLVAVGPADEPIDRPVAELPERGARRPSPPAELPERSGPRAALEELAPPELVQRIPGLDEAGRGLLLEAPPDTARFTEALVAAVSDRPHDDPGWPFLCRLLRLRVPFDDLVAVDTPRCRELLMAVIHTCRHAASPDALAALRHLMTHATPLIRRTAAHTYMDLDPTWPTDPKARALVEAAAR